MKKIFIGAVTAFSCCFAQNAELVKRSIDNCNDGLIINLKSIDTVGKFASFNDIKEMSLINITKGIDNNINSLTFLKNGIIANNQVYTFDENFDENFLNNILKNESRTGIACIRNFSKTSIYDDTNDDGTTVIKILYPTILDLETQLLVKKIITETALNYWINLTQGALLVTVNDKIELENKESLKNTLKNLVEKNNNELVALQNLAENEKNSVIKNTREFGFKKINLILKNRG